MHVRARKTIARTTHLLEGNNYRVPLSVEVALVINATLAPLARFTPYAWLFRYPSAAPTEPSSEPPSATEVGRWLGELRLVIAAVKVAVG